MKKTILNFVLLGAVTPFLVQCASQADLEEVRYQLRIVNKKLEDMRSNTVGQLQKRQAAAFGQVGQVEQDILKLKSQLEETHHLNQRLKEQNKELENTITTVIESEAAKREEALRQFEEAQREKDQRLAEKLDEKLRRQQESVKAIQIARIKEAERRAKEADLAARQAQKRSQSASSAMKSSTIKKIRLEKKKVKLSVVAKRASSSNSTQTVSKTKSEPSTNQISASRVSTSSNNNSTNSQSDDTFAKAQKLYNDNKTSSAFKLFEQVADDSSSPNRVEARLMMGECYFKQKEYDKAIMQYQNIISQHSGHASSSRALLRQGMAFEKLADKDTAKVIYKKLLKKYGSSPEASDAQKRINKM